MERLIQGVLLHVSDDGGISNNTVGKLCSQICSRRFQGVFSADKIPVRKLRRLGDFVVVVNLGRSTNVRGHFVTLSKRSKDDYIEYMDSFALPCFQPEVVSFVEACSGGDGKAKCLITKRVQAVSSVACGLYATLFAAYKDREEEMDFDLRFSTTDLDRNDDRCLDYLRRIVNDM